MTRRELDALVERFQAAAVTRGEWTHRAHLLVGAWHVHHFGPAEALMSARARAGWVEPDREPLP